MSLIATLFDKRITITRLKGVSGFRESYQSTATVDGAVQPIGNSERGGLPSINTKEYVVYADVSTDIKSGDHLEVGFKDATGYTRKIEKFLVKSVEYRVAGAGGGLTEHLEAQVEKLTTQ